MLGRQLRITSSVSPERALSRSRNAPRSSGLRIISSVSPRRDEPEDDDSTILDSFDSDVHSPLMEVPSTLNGSRRFFISWKHGDRRHKLLLTRGDSFDVAAQLISCILKVDREKVRLLVHGTRPVLSSVISPNSSSTLHVVLETRGGGGEDVTNKSSGSASSAVGTKTSFGPRPAEASDDFEFKSPPGSPNKKPRGSEHGEDFDMFEEDRKDGSGLRSSLDDVPAPPSGKDGENNLRAEIFNDVKSLMGSFGEMLTTRFEKKLTQEMQSVRNEQREQGDAIRKLEKKFNEEIAKKEDVKLQVLAELRNSSDARSDIGGSGSSDSTRPSSSGVAGFLNPYSRGDRDDDGLVAVVGSWAVAGGGMRRSQREKFAMELLDSIPPQYKQGYMNILVPGAKGKVVLIRFQKFAQMWSFVRYFKENDVRAPGMKGAKAWASRSESKPERRRKRPISRLVRFLIENKTKVSENLLVEGSYKEGEEAVAISTDDWETEHVVARYRANSGVQFFKEPSWEQISAISWDDASAFAHSNEV